MMNLHISIDDVKGIFKALKNNSCHSIFETRTLNFLQKMHQKYDIKFYLFCTYSDAGYSLEDVPSDYKKEFIDNEDWLKFGFHCYSENQTNQDESYDDFRVYYTLFCREIKRITGQKEQLTALRIHLFKADKEKCLFLRSKGISTLFTSDDDRISYYLTPKVNNKISECGSWYDECNDIMFVRSCTRLEYSDDIITEIDANKGNEIISVFTHEWQMDREEIRNKMELCCKWRKDKNHD